MIWHIHTCAHKWRFSSCLSQSLQNPKSVSLQKISNCYLDTISKVWCNCWGLIFICGLWDFHPNPNLLKDGSLISCSYIYIFLIFSFYCCSCQLLPVLPSSPHRVRDCAGPSLTNWPQWLLPKNIIPQIHFPCRAADSVTERASPCWMNV